MTQSIVVIGGGIIGVTTVYYTARLAKERGLDLTIKLIEGSSIAAGSSGKAGGLLAIDWHGPATAALAELSYGLHSKLAQEYNGKERWGYRKLDTISVGADLTHSKVANGSKVKKLKNSDLFPWLNQEVLTHSSVLGSQETTSQVHPELFTKAIWEEAEKMGVQGVWGTVEGMEKNSQDGTYQLSIASRDDENDKTSLSADQVVVAAGPWTGKLLKSLGVQGGGRARRIDGSRAHSVVLKTAPGRDLPAQALFTSIKEKKGGSAEPEIYNRPDGTAYACGATDSSPLPSHASKVTTDPSAISSILNHTSLLSPSHLSTDNGEHSAQVVRSQACYLPMGSGDSPVLGQIEGSSKERKGVYVASGHSCWGICNGPGSGLVLAEILLDGKATSANISSLSA